MWGTRKKEESRIILARIKKDKKAVAQLILLVR